MDLKTFFPDRPGRTPTQIAADRSWDALVSSFDEEEMSNPELHARNCQKRWVLSVSLARANQEAYDILSHKSDRNFRVVIIGVTLVLVRSFLPPDVAHRIFEIIFGI